MKGTQQHGKTLTILSNKNYKNEYCYNYTEMYKVGKAWTKKTQN